MPQYTFKFDMPNSKIVVTIRPSSFTFLGHYAFEVVSPTGVIFKSTPSTFFSNYQTDAHLTYVNDSVPYVPYNVDYEIPLPLDINGVPLYGTYKFRAFHHEELTLGSSVNNSFSETQQTVNIRKISPSINFEADYNNNEIVILDNTNYFGVPLTRTTEVLSLTNNSIQSSIYNNFSVSPIDTYRVSLQSNTTDTTVITTTYTSTVLQNVSSVILINSAYFYNYKENIVKAKVILDSLAEAACKANRALSGAEEMKYNCITAQLAIIGAAMHFPYSMPTAIAAMKELDKLVK